VLGVLRLTGRNNRDFLCNGSVGGFVGQGPYTRPETGNGLWRRSSWRPQSRTIILGTFDTSEDGTPSPVQCCTNRWLFRQKIAHFLVLSTLQRGEGGEVGKVSQDY